MYRYIAAFAVGLTWDLRGTCFPRGTCFSITPVFRGVHDICITFSRYNSHAGQAPLFAMSNTHYFGSPRCKYLQYLLSTSSFYETHNAISMCCLFTNRCILYRVVMNCFTINMYPVNRLLSKYNRN